MSAATIREALEKAERVFTVKPELADIQTPATTARMVGRIALRHHRTGR